MKPRALILRTAGTNCAVETAYAFELAGAQSESLHLNRVIAEQRLLDQYQLLAIPGGFSYGDDIAAGRIFANQIVHHLSDALHRFVSQSKPIIGICNGFQVLIKTDLLPGALAGHQTQNCTLTHNATGRFVDRWVRLEPQPSRCIWTRGLSDAFDLPIAHGEGRFVPADDAVRNALWTNRQVALTYATSVEADAFSGNPNASVDAVAGICDGSGLILGMMPHPERHVTPLQHPSWSRLNVASDLGQDGAGLRLFRKATEYVVNAVGSGV